MSVRITKGDVDDRICIKVSSICVDNGDIESYFLSFLLTLEKYEKLFYQPRR